LVYRFMSTSQHDNDNALKERETTS
jgi:hypothetical protein